ncbi:MAG: NADH-quinone oxidoreductase subunit L [Deltaproteobacteria bacterium]|nr:NADH-quinone oxidoreductase subunit L [Candidatus Anaeroferrophillus wilburensis]MBN2889221.1 NADH-quinone oxidoreductase subunit L [Deltaproteobacteria bacterium]
MFDKVWLIPIFPIIGVLINGLLGRRIEAINKSIVHWVACCAVALSFLVTCTIFFQMLNLPPDQRLYEFTWFSWIGGGVMQTYIAYQVDPLSMMMCMFVTGVGFLIHIYSIGYMAHDEGRYYRFFTYLNLFMFSMINLILANNYLLMFLGWEGVGLCSYLLIGFWFSVEANAIAGKKAFITNRVGDFAFVIGLLLLFTSLGEQGVWSLRFSEVFPHVHQLPPQIATAVCLLFFVGCTAKSAQIPLYVWLPDAMAGPTPVSALIHAATMVTSGIYLIARSNILYSLSPFAMGVVAIFGAMTALFAASIGLVQNDIKKVLAYSTVSQLGYMFLGLGVGAFAAGMFHVLTHAFFKALLFLGSGAVIHSMHEALHHAHLHDDAQDMRNMGGLKSKMPITYATFLIGTLAIAGIPGLSGFFSKDEILWQAYSSPQGHILLWLIGAIAAGMTAFYMFRLVFMTFFNECRTNEKARDHLHESPKPMTVPLMVLAFLSVVGGYLGVPHALGGSNRIHSFLDPVMGTGPGKLLQKAGSVVAHGADHAAAAAHGAMEHAKEAVGHAAAAAHGAAGHAAEAVHGAGGGHHSLVAEYLLMGISVAIALTGIFLAYTMYIKRREMPEKLAKQFPFLYRLLLNKWYVDELYELIAIKPIHGFSQLLWKGVDVAVVDGIVNGVAMIVGWFSGVVRYLQSGYVQSYAVSIVLGTVVIIVYYFIRAIS